MKQIPSPPFWGGVRVKKWSPFFDSGARSPIFGHLKMPKVPIFLAQASDQSSSTSGLRRQESSQVDQRHQEGCSGREGPRFPEVLQRPASSPSLGKRER